MSKFFGHLKTINKHKREVMKNCARSGIFWRGLLHDLSKYSPSEFIPSVKYFVGYKSPNSVAREKEGVSTAWLHHKGKNKHHFEYWIDYSVTSDIPEMTGMKMPYAYLAEMFCDRVAASKVYKGAKYTDASPYEYYKQLKGFKLIHPATNRELEKLLLMLRDEGEEKTFAFLKAKIRLLRKKGLLYSSKEGAY